MQQRVRLTDLTGYSLPSRGKLWRTAVAATAILANKIRLLRQAWKISRPSGPGAMIPVPTHEATVHSDVVSITRLVTSTIRLPRGGDLARERHPCSHLHLMQIVQLTSRHSSFGPTSIVPNALTAAAFEHVDHLPSLLVHDCSHKLQLFPAEATTPDRGTFYLSDFVCPI
jgi:hypothetical protein